MGLFDYLSVKYPLPAAGANALEFQTKDTPAQYMELYEIREDGTLWYHDHDTEDRSDKNAPVGSFDSIRGMMTSVNFRWVPVPDFTGEICFGGELSPGEYITFSSYFFNGQLKELHLIEHTSPKEIQSE